MEYIRLMVVIYVVTAVQKPAIGGILHCDNDGTLH